MWESTDIPGWQNALDSTRKDQSFAFLGQNEVIAGQEVSPLTPGRLEWLKVTRNPFIVGGERDFNSVAKFLYYLQLTWKYERLKEKEKIDDFALTIVNLNHNEIVGGIYEYLDRAFLDAPTGGTEREPVYSSSAGFYHALNVSYPGGGWTLRRVRDTPIPLIYQLIKVADEARGCTVINRRTYDATKAWGDTGAEEWLEKQRAEIIASGVNLYSQQEAFEPLEIIPVDPQITQQQETSNG